MMYVSGVKDFHPDPLAMAEEYFYASPPEWLHITMYGVTHMPEDAMFSSHVLSSHMQVSFPVQVLDGNGELSYLGEHVAYTHPSDEWVQEVARQLIAGERQISYYEHLPTRLDVCQVAVHRNTSCVEVLRSPRCRD